ncbi:MAG: D-alanyl-D-alanine carboxypeptidase family protein [Candidatus Paceibacterota bacterium]|jgi:LAS superfamily LD-carboxypeptidase LdcB
MINAFVGHIRRNIIVLALILVVGGFVAYQYTQINSLTGKLASLQTQVASTTAEQTQKADELAQGISGLTSQTAGLSNTLNNAQQNIDAVKSQVGGVAQTVGGLQKLATIDPQLLKKYSKVYFLNDNYTPAHLYGVPNDYLYSNKKPEQYIVEAWPFLKVMLDTAKANGITIYINSAYRSFAEQKLLKSTYKVVYGAGTANSFSADQGYSEHQLGTAVDLIMPGSAGVLEGFDKTPGYQWMVANAYRFGFELSYPKGNQYYVSEPWHWRFVGVKLATYLHDNNKNFYDIDQRDIDPYLINIFDN